MRVLISIFVVIFWSMSLSSQSIGVILERKEINIEDETVCFVLKILNLENTDIILADQNYRILYNSSQIQIDLPNTMSLLPTPTYSELVIVSSVEGVDATGTGQLHFDSTLGFFNFFMVLADFINGGITIPANGELAVAEICFDIISDEDIICLDIIIAEEGVTSAYLPVFTSISIWEGNSIQQAATVDSIFSINEMNENSCFTIHEASISLCNDGIDNDEDGLIDCLDPDCIELDVLCEDQFCSDGQDNDRDGLIDCDDPDCISPTLDTVLVVGPVDCDNLLGGLEIQPANDTFLYSVNGGLDFSANNTFSNLEPGEYNVSVQHTVSGCILDYEHNPTNIDTLGCEQLNCGDGIDNDGDGLIDCEDDDCLSPSIDNVIVVAPTDCVTQIGGLEILPANDDYLYSIDGITFATNNTFSNLTTGEYSIAVQHSVTGCIVMYDSNPVSIDTLGCEQLNCSDGLDNDGDGLVDCEDDDCLSPSIDNVLVTNPIDCEAQFGSIEILPANSNYLYSINGIDYGPDNVIENIAAGEYNISVQHVSTGCILVYDNNPTTIDTLGCEQGNCNDGLDNDGDGLVDCDDDDCTSPTITSVIATSPTNCQNQIGTLEILPANDDYLYSIDDLEYFPQNTFENIPSGEYYISVQHIESGCTFTYDNNPAIIETIDCEDDCNDGIDNDQDGMIDCEDNDCSQDFQCSIDVVCSNVLNRQSNNNYYAISLGGGYGDVTLDVSIYDRWGNLMYESRSLEPNQRVLQINFSDIDSWVSGVYVIQIVVNEGLDTSAKSMVKTLTVL